jgi:hypothetical protein
MRIVWSCLAVALTVSLPFVARGGGAGDLDAASEAAMKQVDSLLTDPSMRGQAIAKDPAAKGADEMVQGISRDPAVQQDLYKLADHVFDDLMKKHGGDAAAAMEEITRAQKDPAGFAAGWTPEEKAELKRLGKAVDSAGPPPPH